MFVFCFFGVFFGSYFVLKEITSVHFYFVVVITLLMLLLFSLMT